VSEKTEGATCSAEVTGTAESRMHALAIKGSICFEASSNSSESLRLHLMMKHKTKALTLIVWGYLSSDGFVSLLGIGALRTIAEGWMLCSFAREDCVLVRAKVRLRGTSTGTSALTSPYHVVEMSAERDASVART